MRRPRSLERRADPRGERADSTRPQGGWTKARSTASGSTRAGRGTRASGRGAAAIAPLDARSTLDVAERAPGQRAAYPDRDRRRELRSPPNVALDVAGQLLKSLNTAVLRTGGAALRTVTLLVDDVLRPALEDAGLPSGAVGLVRSADREGARVLVTMPERIPLVILRGSGETTAALARLAAENGVRTLAHAEGGGVLYVHPEADRDRRSR